MILGCHVSFGMDGLLFSAKQAYEYGANCFMFYTGAPQNTIRKPLNEALIPSAHEFMETHGIFLSHIICHAPYIVNLANKSNFEKWQFSIDFLKEEIRRCEMLGVSKMVLHPGSAVGISSFEGLNNIVEALNLLVKDFSSFTILLETMAGKGSECGKSLEEIQYILNHVERKECFGVCLDTCHLSDAGYDMKHFDEFLALFDSLIGISSIGCIHINDSKNEPGSHKDRHENIGFGTIGFDSLLYICNHEALKEVPKILETPFLGTTEEDKKRVYPPYRFEIDMIKKQIFQKDLLNQIRSFYKND